MGPPQGPSVYCIILELVKIYFDPKNNHLQSYENNFVRLCTRVCVKACMLKKEKIEGIRYC